jgi:hypothetical protein
VESVRISTVRCIAEFGEAVNAIANRLQLEAENDPAAPAAEHHSLQRIRN